MIPSIRLIFPHNKMPFWYGVYFCTRNGLAVFADHKIFVHEEPLQSHPIPSPDIVLSITQEIMRKLSARGVSDFENYPEQTKCERIPKIKRKTIRPLYFTGGQILPNEFPNMPVRRDPFLDLWDSIIAQNKNAASKPTSNIFSKIFGLDKNKNSGSL